MKSHLTDENNAEKAILIGVEPKNVPLKTNQVYLDELEFLAFTAGAQCVKRFTQRLEHPNPKTYIGKGKIQEVTAYVKEHEIDLAIFDDELSPSQIRNLEEFIQCKIIDRSSLILDIFAKNARSQRQFKQYNTDCPYITRFAMSNSSNFFWAKINGRAPYGE